jgi:hypothetical protein
MNTSFRGHKGLFTTVLTAFTALRGFSQVSVREMRDAIESDAQEIMEIVNIIMSVVMFAGVIYIATTLIAKREASKGIIVSWIVGMVVWGIGNALLN